MKKYWFVFRTPSGRSWERVFCAASEEEAQKKGVILQRVTRIPLEAIVPIGDDMPRGEMRAMHAYALKGIRRVVVGATTPATIN